MISAAELAQMRELPELNLTEVCEIKEYTLVSDGMGGQVESDDPAVIATEDCRIAPAGSPSESMGAVQVESVGSHVITMRAGVEVRSSQIITSGTRTFQVEGVQRRTRAISTRIDVTEVNAGEGQ